MHNDDPRNTKGYSLSVMTFDILSPIAFMATRRRCMCRGHVPHFDWLGMALFPRKTLKLPMVFHFSRELFNLLLLSFFTLPFFFLFCVFPPLSLISLLLRYDFFFFYLFEKSYFPSFCLMVDYSEIRHLSPSISFFFACLGASLSSSSGHCPQIGGLALGDSSLGLVLVDLYPLLHQSLNWFRAMQGVSTKERMGSEVRLSDLETGLHSMMTSLGPRQIPLPQCLCLPNFPFYNHQGPFTLSRKSVL